ncbi:MAG: tRNA uridine-5-carboxymethylaminomethyl(34) synthesis GTPase MnmE [Lachnospiraceae bacterium]|nr:tRNA uridine-5-carboxymethylaminomethyl(34) synthesis GTPase MnmE [Lachnospiraceae bacterium]
MSDSTIAAIATGTNNNGISIIRLSGDESISICDKIFKSVKNKKLTEFKSHTVHYGYIYDDDEKIDEVLVVLMKGPNSYTKEDVVEINCHGGFVVSYKILDLLIKMGARPAEPGEFTKRAFLNGRIDLSEAESVIDVINSQNDFALKNSMKQLSGYLFNIFDSIRKFLIHELAFIESALDDPEHFSTEGYPIKLREELIPHIGKIDKLIKSFNDGIILKEGIDTAIVGKPNAGKSSLLNLFVGYDRAIVTEIAGTTRDVLEEHINFDGLQLNITDTAGIRDTEDTIEKIGVNKSLECIENSNLILYVIDSSVPLDQNDEDIIKAVTDKKVIVLLNKSDLSQVVSEDDIKERLDCNVIPVSAKFNDGMEELKKLIREMFLSGDIKSNDEVFITNARQKDALVMAYDSLKNVIASIDDGMPEDFFSIDMMNAYDKLGLITGESVEDDLMEEIFKSFCVGK